MRNAAANFDDDIDFDDAPVRKKAARKGRASPARKKKKGPRFGVDMTKVARYSAIGMSATVALGVMVNALMLQKGHHPAPLFAKADTQGSATADTKNYIIPAAPKKVAALPAPAPADASAPAESTASIPVPPAKPKHGASADASAKGGEDSIAKLLKSSTGGPAPSAEKPEAKTVLGVQKALVKLGYVLKPNGNLGPATKKAIEMFEKDRKLPVNGDLSRRLVKVISAESGVKID